jgi:hypothetical protein
MKMEVYPASEMLWVFQIKVLVSVHYISRDSVICETRMTRQVYQVAVSQCLHVIRQLKLNFYWLFLRQSPQDHRSRHREEKIKKQ